MWAAQPTAAFLSRHQVSSSSRKDISLLTARGCFPVTSSQKQLETDPRAQVPFPFLFPSCFLLQNETTGIWLKESTFITSKALMPPAATGWAAGLCWGDSPAPAQTSCWLKRSLRLRGCVSHKGLAQSCRPQWIQALGMLPSGHLFPCTCIENQLAGKPIPEIQNSASDVLQESFVVQHCKAMKESRC